MLIATPHYGNTKGTKLPPEPLAKSEIESLINACSHRAPTGLRNRALIVMLWRGMLRINEALALKPADIDLATGTVRILHGKGNKARTVAIDPTACAVVAQWLAVRNAGPHCRLFCTLAGQPMLSAYVRRLLPRLGRKAGLTKRIHAHGLRHSSAAACRAAGIDVGIISKALGHSSIATTARYLDHIQPQAVLDVMRAGAW